MRIAVVSHPCFRAINRKVHIALKERGAEVMLIVPDRLRGETPDPPAVRDPLIHFLPLSSENPRSYRFVGAEPRLAAFKPDIVLLEADPVSLASYHLGRWCKHNGARFACLSVDNLDFGLVPHIKRAGVASAVPALAKTLLHRATVPLVDSVFTISSDGTQVFKGRGYRRVTQVPLGFDKTIFYRDAEAGNRARQRCGIPPASLVYGYFGRITPLKGVHLIVQALAELSAAGALPPNWRLLLDKFQSHDSYSQKIKEQIAAGGLSENVVYFEADHQEIADYMRATDAVVLASISSPQSREQYGRVIPEGMACGALAIVSDCGTPKDLVGPCGLVFKEADASDLKSKLADFANSPEAYRGMRAAGAERMASLFTIERQADIYLQTFQSLMAA